VTTNHGAGVLKAIAGPDFNFTTPKAHIGDFLQVRARIFSSSGVYTNVVIPGPPGSFLLVTNLVDISHHFSGITITSNLLGTNTILLTNNYSPTAPSSRPGSFF